LAGFLMAELFDRPVTDPRGLLADCLAPRPDAPFAADAPDLSGLGDLLNLSRQEVLDALFDAAIDSFDLALPDAAFGAPDQPRLPAGQAGGGEWTSGGGGVPSPGLAVPETYDEAVALAERLKAAVVQVCGAGEDVCHDATHGVIDAFGGRAERYEGLYPDEDGNFVTHQIVKVGDFYLDLTADQFGGDPVVVLDQDDKDSSRLYRNFSPRRASSGSSPGRKRVKDAVLAADAPFYSPGQPRVPAGQPGGGEWGSGGGGGASVRPAALEDYARAVESWKQDRALWTFTPNFGFQNVHFAWDGAGKLTGWVGWDVSPAGALNFAIDTRRDVRSPALAGRLLRAFLSSPDRARVTSIEAVAVTDAGQRMVESLAKRLGVPWTGERRTGSATPGGPPAVAPAEAPEKVPGRLGALAARLRGFFGGGEAQFSWDAWAALDGPAGEAAFALAEDAPFYSPDQPRVPAGQPGGGRWAGGVSPGTTAARDAASDAVRAFARGRGPATAREAHALAGHLAKLTVSQIHALKAQHGLKGSAPNKAALVAKLAQRFRDARAAAGAAAPATAPAPAPVALTHAQWVAAGQPLPLLYQAWLAAGQPPATQAFPIPPALLPPTPPPPAPAPARAPAFVPGPQGPVPNPVLNRGANVITGAPAKAAVPVVPFAAERAWETGKPEPGVLNGIPFAPAPHHFWEKVPDVDVKEPPLTPPGVNPSRSNVKRAGILVREPDGRVWIVQPTNSFGNRDHTLPGGGVEPGLTTQQNALKEVWEETGLQVKITGYAGDFEDSNRPGLYGRLYVGERVGGAPWDAKVEASIVSRKTGNPAAESETVTLVTPERAAQLLHRTDDLAQLAMVHPISIKTNPAKNVISKIVGGVQPAALDYARKKTAAGESPGDATLHAVQEARGFNGKPAVVKKADFDALLSQGNHIEMLRGIAAIPPSSAHGATNLTPHDMAEQFKTGEHFPGHGMFGVGTYADSTKGSQNAATGSYSAGGEVMRIALPKTAKVVKFAALKDATGASAPGGYKTPAGKNPADYWRGVHAALAGYDAIHVDDPSRYGHGYYVILNRSILTVQKEKVDRNYTIK
jgi:ADP-ribose pyrophosphatase YjhB (NUDIX family)